MHSSVVQTSVCYPFAGLKLAVLQHHNLRMLGGFTITTGTAAQVTQVSNERTEAESVVSTIRQLHKQGRQQWKDMAILYRTNAQSRLFEEQLVS